MATKKPTVKKSPVNKTAPKLGYILTNDEGANLIAAYSSKHNWCDSMKELEEWIASDDAESFRCDYDGEQFYVATIDLQFRTFKTTAKLV